MEMRTACRADIPKLVELGEEFANLSQPIHRFSVSRERIIEFTNDVVENPNAVVLVLVVEDEIQGFIVGLIARIYFSEMLALQELAWYVRKGFKGLVLLEGFEKMAVGNNCQRVVVGNKPQYYDLKRTYERRGFTLLENQYVKNIEVS